MSRKLAASVTGSRGLRSCPCAGAGDTSLFPRASSSAVVTAGVNTSPTRCCSPRSFTPKHPQHVMCCGAIAHRGLEYPSGTHHRAWAHIKQGKRSSSHVKSTALLHLPVLRGASQCLGYPKLCCVGIEETRDPLLTTSLVPSHNYAAFPASWNLSAPSLLSDVSTSSVAAAQTSLLCCRRLSHRVRTD